MSSECDLLDSMAFICVPVPRRSDERVDRLLYLCTKTDNLGQDLRRHYLKGWTQIHAQSVEFLETRSENLNKKERRCSKHLIAQGRSR
mmetsp:Transcript_11476/g.23348  ORF Transcript_11476/g.23348 Transcript_11476/m.23348 type:complete len:88 (-) Transcript_11476:1093-1356(-)